MKRSHKNVRKAICASILILFLFTGNSRAQSGLSQSDLFGTWKGELLRNGFSWTVHLHVGQTSEQNKAAEISFPDWGMYHLKTDKLITTESTIEFTVLWINRDFKAALHRDSLKVDWNNGEAKGQMYRFKREPELFKSEEITLKTDDGAVLKGTIIFPDAEPPSNGMVLTHGSGPDTRQTGPYIGKAMLAVEQGLAVLVYDKRGAGESTGEGAYKIDRLASDAKGMVDLLRSHPLIESSKVGIGGISQGAWVAPKVAFDDPEIAFVFAAAVPGLPPSEQNVFTLETRFMKSSVSEEKINYAKKALRTLYEFYRTGNTAYRDKAESLINDPKYNLLKEDLFKRMMFSPEAKVYECIDVQDWATMFVDPLMWWREITVPVVAFSGEDDLNIPTDYSLSVIEAALKDARNTHYEIHSYPNAGHGLTLENGPEGDWPRMAPGYVPMMAAWFKKMAKQ